MKKGRLEAFSDGVFAIIITIMVLELVPPHGETFGDLAEIAPIFIAYVLSFAFVGIYWNNHHHLFQVVERVDGGVLWANLFMLFWLSLLPFGTAWFGETHFAAQPVTLYGVILLMAGMAYYILSRQLVRLHAPDSLLVKAIGNDIKGKISLALLLISIPVSFVNSWVSVALFVVIAIMWFVPDRRMEKALESGSSNAD